MGVFTFVCRSSGDLWTAKQLSGDLEVSASSTYDLQRLLLQVLALAAAASSGDVQTSFSMVTPSSAVFQAVVDGNGAFIGGGGAAPVCAAPVGSDPATKALAEAKKEEEDESTDDDMEIALFD